MASYLDLDQWNRKEHFRFYKDFDDPFFNICAEVEISAALAHVKECGFSFFISYLYLALKSTNAIPAFRYRLRGEQVLVHEVIHAGSTVLNPDQTFGFCYFDYHPNFRQFHDEASEKLKRYAAGNKKLEPRDERDDLIHCSVIPWISFTSFSHAKRFKTQNSVPKIVFGKYDRSSSAARMPVSVEAHHALMDGLHVGQFFESLQEFLLNPNESLMA